VNFGCSHNKELVTDVICHYKPARGNLGTFGLGGTPLKPLTTVWMKFDIFKKNSANIWLLGKVHLIQDICKFYEEKNNLILHLFANFKETLFDKVVRKCPYTVCNNGVQQGLQ
jgi:hypothetical protein